MINPIIFLDIVAFIFLLYFSYLDLKHNQYIPKKVFEFPYMLFATLSFIRLAAMLFFLGVYSELVVPYMVFLIFSIGLLTIIKYKDKKEVIGNADYLIMALTIIYIPVEFPIVLMLSGITAWGITKINKSVPFLPIYTFFWAIPYLFIFI